MRTSRNAQRGSTLLIAMILLLALTVMGTAAVTLASQDRSNASAQGRYQRLVECASAAQAVIWAQLAQFGKNYVGSGKPIGSVTLPDGTKLEAPIHYDQDAATTFANVAYSVTSGGGGAVVQDVDCTNRLCGQGMGGGGPVNIVARCTDAFQRQYEVEMSFVFAL